MQHVEKGDRIKFLGHILPDPAPLEIGEEGTVTALSGKSVRPRQIHVAWDSGRTLMLIDDGDKYEVIGHVEK